MKVMNVVAVMFVLLEGAVHADPPVTATHGGVAAGTEVALRVRQVMPADGLSRGERMLNGEHPLKAGDLFTAEWPSGPGQPPVILAGCVEEVIPPRRFGRPGKVSVRLAWPYEASGRPCRLDIEDQRFTSAQKRRAITTLFLAEGFAVGSAVGANLDHGRAAATLGGGGVGLVLGLAYASLQPGQAASLEPGDTLKVVVGTTEVKKLPPEIPFTVYPAQEPEEEEDPKPNPRKETSR